VPKENRITPDKISDKITQFKTFYVLLINVWQMHINEQIASCSSVLYATFTHICNARSCVALPLRTLRS